MPKFFAIFVVFTLLMMTFHHFYYSSSGSLNFLFELYEQYHRELVVRFEGGGSCVSIPWNEVQHLTLFTLFRISLFK